MKKGNFVAFNYLFNCLTLVLSYSIFNHVRSHLVRLSLTFIFVLLLLTISSVHVENIFKAYIADPKVNYIFYCCRFDLLSFFCHVDLEYI